MTKQKQQHPRRQQQGRRQQRQRQQGRRQVTGGVVAMAAAAAIGAYVVPQEAARASIRINEVMVDAPGVNATQDFIELRSTSGGVESVSDLTMLYIEGEAGAVGGSGAIDHIVTFSGSTGTNGLFLRHSFTDPVSGTPIQPSPAPAAETTQQYGGWNHENAAITYILVSGFTGQVGQDIDQNDDGVIDYAPWSGVMDAFGYADGDAFDKIYGSALGFTDFSDQVQNTNISTAFRSPDGVFHSARLATVPVGGPYTTNSSRTVQNGFTLSPGNVNNAVTTAYRAWAGTAGGNWSAGGNWVGGVAPAVAGDIAMFDGSAANTIALDANATVGTLSFGGGNQTISAGGGTLTMNATGTPLILVNYGTPTIAAPIAFAKTTQIWVGGGQTLTTTGGISGTGNLDKRAGGILRLGGTNTYDGNTVVTTGTVLADSTAALPNWNVAARVTVAINGTLAVAAGGAGQWSTADIDTLIATTTFAAPGTNTPRFGFNVDAGNTYTHPSGVGRSIGVTKLGAGELVLEGANTYTGPTDVLAGTLKLTAANQLPTGTVLVVNAGTLNLNGNDQTVSTASVGQSGTITGAGTLTATTFGVSRGTVNSNLAGGSLTKTGPFTVTLGGANTYTGGTTLTAGTLSVSANNNLGDAAGALTFDGGTLQVTGTSLGNLGTRPVNWNTFHGGIDVADATHTLTVNDGITIRIPDASVTAPAMTKSGAGTLAVNFVRGNALEVENGTLKIARDATAAGASNVTTLSIGANGRLDLTNNKLVTATPLGTFNGTAYSGVQGEIARAYNFGTWDQPGLMTSEDLADPTSGPLGGTTTIAVNKASEVLFIGDTDTGVFAGQTVTGATTLAMYTYAGDVNLDGLVDAADYGVIDNWVQFPGTDGYMNGDFNYDGVIDAADYGIIDNTVQLQGAPFPTGAGTGAGLAGVAAVPEPASLSLVGLAAATLLARRRRATR